jgi:hypothetical protein
MMLMNVPRGCINCRFLHDGSGGCGLVGDFVGYRGTRPDWCPLNAGLVDLRGKA